jgi:uncharacterized LabA/DUF88 family protein
LKIAVFIDFDNIEIGVKTTLSAMFDVGAVLEAIKERGEVVTKVAYGDWKRAGEHSRSLTQHAIRMVQRNVTPGGDKNGADINLALDALEMALTHDHINAYVIVGGDSDFITLVEKLKQYDKKVFVVGGRAFTSLVLQKNCHEFIAYENLIPQPSGRRVQERARPAAPSASMAHAFPLVRRALQVLSEREVSPQLGLLKSTLLQLDSTFSERDYGAGTFRDFAEKLAQAGLVTLKQAGRSILVELSDGAEAPEPPVETAAGAVEETPEPASQAPAAPPTEPARPATPPLDQSEGIRLVQRVFETMPNAPRWPMYVRNVKQILRGSEAGFDERRFGFQGILELLRACQRDGILRLERDRQGVLRVFPGSLLQRPAAEAVAVGAAARVAEVERAPEPVVEAVGDVEAVEQEAEPEIEAEVVVSAEPVPAPIDVEPVMEAPPAASASAVPVEVEETGGEAAAAGREDVEPATRRMARPRRRRPATGPARKTAAAAARKTTRPARTRAPKAKG